MKIPTYREEIHEAARTLGIPVRELSENAAHAILEDLSNRYGANDADEINHNNIKPNERASVQHPDSWMWVDEYVSDEPVLLFYESNLPQDHAMFRIPSGRHVVRLLRECTPFEYYVTNDGGDYLICHTHHDYVVGTGAAKQWVESLGPRHDEWAKTLTKGAENPDAER